MAMYFLHRGTHEEAAQALNSAAWETCMGFGVALSRWLEWQRADSVCRVFGMELCMVYAAVLAGTGILRTQWTSDVWGLHATWANTKRVFSACAV